MLTWDERRISASGKGCHIESHALLQQSLRGRKTAGYGLEHLTAIDLHECGGVKPVSMCGTPSRLRVCHGSASIKKIASRAQVQSCGWHPNRFLGAFAAGGKLTLLDQPVIMDSVVATEVFDL